MAIFTETSEYTAEPSLSCIDIARKLKAKGFSVEDISEIAGLTIEEVKKLLQ